MSVMLAIQAPCETGALRCRARARTSREKEPEADGQRGGGEERGAGVEHGVQRRDVGDGEEAA